MSADSKPSDRLIFALDFPAVKAAEDMIGLLGPSVNFYKIGLQLFLTGEAVGLGERLHGEGKMVFLDLKLFDVPETVASAVKQLGQWATFTTVHAQPSLIESAAGARATGTKILAVTVLTSLDRADLQKEGIEAEVSDLVLLRAKAAAAAGADGVIASGREAAMLRRELGDDFLIVTPGIRDEPAAGSDDQKRTMTVQGAFQAGADYIVVGRPIRSAPDPRRAAEAIQETIAALFT